VGDLSLTSGRSLSNWAYTTVTAALIVCHIECFMSRAGGRIKRMRLDVGDAQAGHPGIDEKCRNLRVPRIGLDWPVSY